jgi:hypothetical protein
MTDPLFGSVSQQWPAIQVPAFGYAQTPMPFGPRSPGFLSPVVTMQGAAPLTSGMLPGVPTPNLPSPGDPAVFGGMMPAFAGLSSGAGLSAVVSNPMAAGVPAFTGPEIAVGVTAPALLAAVAMRRGQPLGPTNDQEIEDFIYDAFDLLPGASDVEVRCEGGRAILTGSVPHKRIKRDVGEIAWAIPTLQDVQNNITIATRRRSRATSRETETTPAAAGRK